MFVQSDGAPQINEGLEVTDKDKLGFWAALGGSGTVGAAVDLPLSSLLGLTGREKRPREGV